jgi:hypothetical protein
VKIVNDNKFVTERHRNARLVFRILGPLLLLIGVACLGTAMFDFFTLEGFEQPEYFWLFFAGMPFLFVGFVLTGLGFGGSVAKYQSREYAPVAKDTFNYLAKETTSGVENISRAIQTGQERTITGRQCPNCHTKNEENANFCYECGSKLNQVCKSCNNENDYNARFCDNCGTSL